MAARLALGHAVVSIEQAFELREADRVRVSIMTSNTIKGGLLVVPLL